ncbi:hypothetical protein VTK56DRAFT_4009 [Thermocarpiscus australiensis]
MATSQAQTQATAPAPWREAFLSHLSTLPQPTFTLATLHPAPSGEAPSAGLPALPRARTCILRGMWACLPFNAQNNNTTTDNAAAAPRNPPLFESDLPVFTTDARSDKAAELFDSAGGAALAASAGGTGATGGGGPAEACFWSEEAKTQWRVRGTAWLLAGDADSEGEGPRKVKEVLMGRMRRRRIGRMEGGEEEEEGKGWSFAREVTAHFANLSPIMRGSFKAPAPGTPVAYPPREGEALGQRLDDLEDEMARRNFRVVVIVPEEVDQVDLSDQMRPMRWLYVYRGAGGTSKLPGGEIIGEWEKVEVWP